MSETTAELAKRLRVSERRVRYLAAHDRIPGAQQRDGRWVFPSGTVVSRGKPRGRPRIEAPIHTTPPPPLKWAGGKRWLLPVLARLWVRHQGRRLVEPFAGGLAVSLGLRPAEGLVNDINPHLINFYRWVRRGLRFRLEMKNESSLYYRHRERFNALIRNGEVDSREAAELFYFLNRTGYNGLCRFNRSGFFNVPYGRHKAITYGDDLLVYREIIRRWHLACGDFEDLQINETDFIFADAPYDVEFTAYTRDGFRWEDQERLVAWLRRHPGPVVATNQATPRMLDLYRRNRFSIKVLDAPRAISCTGA